ncbi:MAG: elongation factor Ts [Bdellovibrionales bacterium RIFOXYB1_FULL_37_110]|nr:MAG: elongation factor Ts [Bdellovibrionales bacterium RIFOXYC1_FULL_37_79]OFZ59867.1 MAG: elongation factor Ts [Bdellovibrionales bacterium RIFOXYB1_FULL_37_110]OFZ65481.1 MAG: elongation factor Ts [Bdellovibrionales bacterium RIFOXYD1_FULL_36_51]OFZ67560.1 MAG: elongation factor Ts [Bdellovibrionales bacterium RIFOXYB2_FULL_36_6]
MSFTANDVKDLREKTGAGMMDCKKALLECKGNMDDAVDYLRKKGLAAAQKKQGRIAAEGIIGSYIHMNNKIGVIVEVNCETDFVAKNPEFQNFAHDVAMHIAAADPKFVRDDEMDENFKNKEAEIYAAQLKEQGKPEKMIPKIVEGKLSKLAEEVCLYNQKFVKNPDKTVNDLINELTLRIGEKISVRRFHKFIVGEGMKKREDNLAAEIAAMTK